MPKVTWLALNLLAASATVFLRFGYQGVNDVDYLVLLATWQFLHPLESFANTSLWRITMRGLFLSQDFLRRYSQSFRQRNNHVRPRQFSSSFPETQIRGLNANLSSNSPEREARSLSQRAKRGSNRFR